MNEFSCLYIYIFQISENGLISKNITNSHPILFSDYQANIENNQHDEYELMECDSMDYQPTEFQSMPNFMDSTSINGFDTEWPPIPNFMDDDMSTFAPFNWDNNNGYDNSDLFHEI